MAKGYPRIREWLELNLGIDFSKETPESIEEIAKKTRFGQQKGKEAIIQWLKEEVLKAAISRAKLEKTPKTIWSEKTSSGLHSWSIERWKNGWITYSERINGRFINWEKL
ncbi:MAG: hypothetical protein QXJ07_03390 [Candidatus Bathyarchaeia archaeon]